MTAYLAGDLNGLAVVLALAAAALVFFGPDAILWLFAVIWQKRIERHRARTEPTYEHSPYGDRHDR